MKRRGGLTNFNMHTNRIGIKFILANRQTDTVTTVERMTGYVC